MDDFDLRYFREQKLNWTQMQLAERLGVQQDVISRIENGSRTMTLDLFLRLCEVAGMTPDEVLKFRLSRPHTLEVASVYSDFIIRRNTLTEYIAPRYEEFLTEDFNSEFLEKVQEINEVIQTYQSKPLVALMGPSDAGKSRLINAVTGMDRLLKSQWTPTTAVTVYVKHVEDRPKWMDDTVWIFGKANDQPWNFRRFYDEEYCRSLKLAGGSLDVLQDYCNRDSGFYSKGVDSAVVYVDAPILKTCDIVDLPGFGTESASDTVYSQRAREQADVIIFLCQSNAFFNKHEDVLFLKEIIHRLPPIHQLSDDAPVLSNLFVVASQAKFVGEENVSVILERGYSALSNQLSDDLIQQRFDMRPSIFRAALRERFFTYATESDGASLRARFEVGLKQVLENVLPPIRINAFSRAICDLKVAAKGYFEQQVEYCEAVFSNIEAARAEADRLERDKYEKFNAWRAQKSEVIHELESHRKRNRDELRAWEKHAITVKRIASIINEKKYSRKEAQEFLAANVSDLYFAKLQDLLQASTVQFSEKVTQFFKDVEDSLTRPDRISTGPIHAPFDFKGALAGGLAGMTVLGGLGLWAGAMGNLGGYILVAQGVGLLSSLGISVGGGAAAVSAVAAIGGPITIGIAIALGTFLVVRAIVGDTWKERLAKKLLDALQKEALIDQYIDSLEQYWSSTREGIDKLVDSIIFQYERYIQQQREIASTEDPKKVLELAEKAKRMRDFFGVLPWACSSTEGM